MTVCLVFPGRPTLTPNDPVNYSQCHFDSQKCFGLNLDSLGKCHLRQRLLDLPMCALLLLLLLSSFSRVRLCVTIRLHRPWDSPGKNTGVGCHFLLQCMKVKSESALLKLSKLLHGCLQYSEYNVSLPGMHIISVLFTNTSSEPFLFLELNRYLNLLSTIKEWIF